ncbi:hypothetical protein F4823DRAFT_622275 [Ustulina deusta]|nr:hypothetical protein F4823DRAFT_622275 [Ustulina deusta]
MSVHGFVGQPLSQQQFRTAASSKPAIHPFDHEASAKPIGTPFGVPPSSRQVLIRCLPPDTTNEQVQLMLLFSQELVSIEVLPLDRSQDVGLRSAIVRFNTLAGAQQAKEMLHGKSTRMSEAELVVEIMSGSPTGSRRYPIENGVSTQLNGSTSITSPVTSSRQPPRFSDTFQSLEKIGPPSNGLYPINDVTESDYYQNIFSPQSPIGNHLTNQTHSLGKTLIHDTAEDDETRELLKDPVAYAENGATQQRRATAPHLPITRLANLSLNTTTNGTTPITPYAHSTMTPLSAHGNNMSPTMMNGTNHSVNFQMSNFNRHNFPPVNPADQNPPCNTLYVGNLPIDTSEEELKAMFQKQRGYKRLCFRTKQNGPMCFVEFEDVSHATRALHELYGKLLHNSVKGGIRLSFSKNPLGVRSGQTPGPPTNGSMASMNGLMAASGNSFPITNRPPPGLATPPGLNRVDYSGNNQSASSGTTTPSGYPGSNSHVWSGPLYNGHHSAAGSSSPPNGPTSSYLTPFMMGR